MEAERIKEEQHARAKSARDKFLELTAAVIQPTMAAVSHYVAPSVQLEITERADENNRQGTSMDAEICIHTGTAEGGRTHPTSLSFIYQGGERVSIQRSVGSTGALPREIRLSDITSDLVEKELVAWIELISATR